MEERRQNRRFTLRLPCLVYAWDNDPGEMLCHAYTSNIGIGGVFIETDLSIPQGFTVKVELILKKEQSPESDGAGSYASINGRILRNGGGGVAIGFDGDYRMMRISEVIGLSKARTQWLQCREIRRRVGNMIPVIDPIGA